MIEERKNQEVRTENIEKSENFEAQIIADTKASQAEALKNHPDLAQSVSSATDLDISPTDTPQAQAEKQAKQEQVAQQL